jgi:hypothetical protein
MKTIFKKGDKVYFHIYGWGKIIDIDFDFKVKFESLDYSKYFDDETSKLLSFTEYKLDGFSQERPEELPQKCDIVWVKDDKDGAWLISHFIKKENGLYYCSDAASDDDYSMPFAYLTTKNPYSDEKN